MKYLLICSLLFSALLAIAPITAVAQSASIYTYQFKWGSFGSGNGQFNSPYDVAIDSSGNVYVSDTNNQRIQKFTSSGAFIMKYGVGGIGPGQFKSPFGVDVDSSENVYVVDYGNFRIQKFSSSGTFITMWGAGGPGNGQFSYPQGISIDSSGNVYVVDTGNHRIQKFSSSGTFITKWGSVGNGNGQFMIPVAVATDSSGNVYVVDHDNHRIQKFTSSGTYITKWGSFGGGNGQFNGPSGIAVDSFGDVYVTEEGGGRVQKFTSSGAFITQIGGPGSDDGQFSSRPLGLAVNNSGNVYVVDSVKKLIQVFAPSATSITHMSDTTASFASLVSAPRQVMAEYVSPTSQLIGDKIDQITLKLQKVGSPTGMAQVGIFNSDLSVKKLFATKDVSTVSTTATNYTFQLPTTDPLYTITTGDRIGIKYTGGSSTVGLNITPDRDAADPFDGTNSYRVRYETGWISSTSEDMYMILKQTRADPILYPITHMSDTTASFASLVSSPRQLMAEFVGPSSQLVGDKIDSITLRLQRVSSPTGTAQVGVFNADLSVKKLFATVDVATLSTTASNIEFKLPATDPLYTIAIGDRIGIKYTGGSASVGINVTPDRDAADPFDGSNSYRMRYESSWLTSAAEDLYMILKQTHG